MATAPAALEYCYLAVVDITEETGLGRYPQENSLSERGCCTFLFEQILVQWYLQYAICWYKLEGNSLPCSSSTTCKHSANSSSGYSCSFPVSDSLISGTLHELTTRKNLKLSKNMCLVNTLPKSEFKNREH